MQTLIRGVLSAALLAGCATAGDPVGNPDEDVLQHGEMLVAIPRNIDPDDAARTSSELKADGATAVNPNGDFYVAFRKSALEERWFWSVYLKELAPFGPSPGTLGTRVVRFRVQNDKLFVFDADDRRATSDVFSPDLVIDAFPLVHSSHFNALPGSGGYLLIDPSAGANRYGALADALGGGGGAIKLETEVSFLQNFKKADDGGSFEQVFTAYADQPIGIPGDTDTNDFRIAATVGVTLRKYSETPAYMPVAAPAVAHYFLSDPINVKNTGMTKQNAVHWGFANGMQPVKWVIGPEITALGQQLNVDLFAAMKRGIESWNDVLGFPVFTVSLAQPGDSFDDDHVNYVIIDPDTSKGYAYADWRTNPNTGEIRGASIYFGGGFFSPLPDDPMDPQPSGIKKPSTKPKATRPSLVWQDQQTAPSCVIFAPDTKKLTGAEKMDKYIQHVIAHEVGHTLGLRHNFKGSLVPPSSSLMEYSDLDSSVAAPTPGAYDIAAIKFLYGQATTLPTQPFCTDEDTLSDPNCVRFDPPTATPLTDYQIPLYNLVVSLFTDGQIPAAFADLYFGFYGTELLGYARAGTPAEAAAAWNTALNGLRAPIPAATLAAKPSYGAAADAISAWIFKELYVQPAGAIAFPISDAAVITQVANDGKAILLNADGVRSYATRRIVVDALKRAQNTDAYLALVAARDGLNAQIPSLSPNDQALTRDLVARIDAAISPYFE